MRDGVFSRSMLMTRTATWRRMPHLPMMEWDFKDQLHATRQQVVNNAPGEKTFYVYDCCWTARAQGD